MTYKTKHTSTPIDLSGVITLYIGASQIDINLNENTEAKLYFLQALDNARYASTETATLIERSAGNFGKPKQPVQRLELPSELESLLNELVTVSSTTHKKLPALEVSIDTTLGQEKTFQIGEKLAAIPGYKVAKGPTFVKRNGWSFVNYILISSANEQLELPPELVVLSEELTK